MSEGAPEVEARAGRSQRALERLRAAVGAEPVRADAVPDDLLLSGVQKFFRAPQNDLTSSSDAHSREAYL